MTNLLALPGGTELVGDFRIKRVLGAGGFGITYLADEMALARQVTIKEYFPSDFAARNGERDATPRSRECAGDYKWGLERFIEEAQTLARFDHPNIVRVYRYFRSNNTGYMVLHFEEGKSFKTWLKDLGRAPRQTELDQIVAPLLDALELIHKGDFLHRDIAPDNIMIRRDKTPVLIDFGSARGEIASHSRTVSALVKPGYSPYEQYATTTSQQGPWTDIYALGATLYQAIAGKRPPDAPSRMVQDEYIPARDAALGSFRGGFLTAIDKALRLDVGERPRSIADWRGPLFAPDPRPAKARLGAALGLKRTVAAEPDAAEAAPAASQTLAAGQSRLGATPDAATPAAKARTLRPAAIPIQPPARLTERLDQHAARHGLGYGPPPAAGRLTDLDTAFGPMAAPAPAALPPTRIEAAVPMPIRRPRTPLWRHLLFFTRKPWRGLLAKFGAGIAVASLAVSYQNQHAPAPVTVRTPQATQNAANLPAADLRASNEPRAHLQLAGQKAPILALTYAGQGRRIAAAGSDGALRIWDGESGALARSIAIGDAPVAFAIGPSLALAAQSDGTLILTDIERGDRVAASKRPDGNISVLALAGDGERPIAGTGDGRIVVWDRTVTAALVASEETHAGAVTVLRALPGRNLVASGGTDRTLRLWSSDTASLERIYRGHNATVTAIDPAPDGRAIASAADDGQIRIWSAVSTRHIRSIRAHAGRIGALAYAPGGEVLASGGADGVVKLWDARRGKSVLAFTARVGAVRGFAFSPDGRRLAVAGDDATIRVWDLGIIRLARD